MTHTHTPVSLTRIYLRASTKQQDALRAKEILKTFASERKLTVAHIYTENESGSKLDRPELFQLIADSAQNDILLVESTDRLTRLDDASWTKLKELINAKGIRIVVLDLPTSHQQLEHSNEGMTSSIMKAINNMLLDIMAAMSHKDYIQRKERSAQGLDKAKKEGRLIGKQENKELNERITKALSRGVSWSECVDTYKVSRSQVAKLAKILKAAGK